MGYTVPRLHEGKQWYVDFKAFDPESGELKRKKYYITKQRKKAEMRKEAASLIERLNSRLRKGWTPWADVNNIRGTKLLDDMLNKYVSHVGLNSKKKTVDSYRSRVNVLREFISTLGNPPMYCYQYTRSFIMDFLDWMIEERKVNPRTRNNYRAWCGTFAQFLIERECLDDNPALKISNLKETDKIRQPMSHEQLTRLQTYLAKRDPHMLLACMMEYYTFIRPGELRHVRLSYISLKEQTVYVPAEVSKNSQSGMVSLNEELIRLMLTLRVFESPGDFYLFGPKLRPSSSQAPEDIFNKRFTAVRKALGFPEEIKFYSLKDSGVRDLGEDAGIITAQNQARHSDVATTNKYLQGRDREAPEKAKHFSGVLKAPEELPLHQ